MNQLLKRKNERISKLLKEIRVIKEEVSKLRKDAKKGAVSKETLKKVMHQKSSNASYWRNKKSTTILKLKDKIKKLQELCRESEQRTIELEASQMEQQDASSPIIETRKDKKTYDDNIRKCIYYCLQSQVPTDQVSNVITYIVKEMTGMELSFTPSKSCVSRIAREMGIIADMQGADTLLTSNNSTLSWYGTSLKGLHLNEVHVTTEDQSVVLGISSLPGGTTEDYTNDILKTVNDLMGNYSNKKGLEKEATTKQAKDSISNTLTDRVAVNHCAVKELEKDFGKNLNELNCNVHPIDGLANKARTILKEREGRKEIGSKLFGTDCISTKIVLNVSKLKHKQGVGDPSSFGAFLKMSNISPTLLTRYVGNRFNILFKLAGSIFHLRKEMIEYLDKWCVSSKLGPALLSDIESQEGLLQLQALGLFGKLLTGTWMSKIYGEKENIHHLELRFFSGELLMH